MSGGGGGHPNAVRIKPLYGQNYEWNAIRVRNIPSCVLSSGINKSQIYMKFTLIYLVFCIVYHLFWTFWCVFLSCRWCSSRKIEEQAKSSKKESKEAMLGKAREHAAAWFCHAAAWDALVKNPRPACRGMPNSCRSMPRRFENNILKPCPNQPSTAPPQSVAQPPL